MRIQIFGLLALRKGHNGRARAYGGYLPGVIRRNAVIGNNQCFSLLGQILRRTGQRAPFQYNVVTAAGIFNRKNHAFTPL